MFAASGLRLITSAQQRRTVRYFAASPLIIACAASCAAFIRVLLEACGELADRVIFKDIYKKEVVLGNSTLEVKQSLRIKLFSSEWNTTHLPANQSDASSIPPHNMSFDAVRLASILDRSDTEARRSLLSRALAGKSLDRTLAGFFGDPANAILAEDKVVGFASDFRWSRIVIRAVTQSPETPGPGELTTLSTQITVFH